MSPPRKIHPAKENDGVDKGNSERVPVRLETQYHRVRRQVTMKGCLTESSEPTTGVTRSLHTLPLEDGQAILNKS